ncbi:MAG TPA: hypothetical protein VK206_18365, partial [Anaerolineales bacterium]|nr:hypothetical protein [Anaerolineales bacterium]
VLKITIPVLLLIAIALVLILIGFLSGRKSLPPGKVIKLSDSPGYEITLSNVPENVTPRLLKIDNDKELRDYEKDGTKEIVFIAGNLVFSDANGDTLVTSFNSPVRLTFSYTAEAEQRFIDYRNTLVERGVVASKDEVKLIPIYLYTHTYEDKERPELHIWKPFQNFLVDEANRTMTIEFLFWGDQQVGGGTRP